MKRFLTQIALGRMALHFVCLCRGGRREFHCGGMRRALREITGRRA